MDRRALNPRTRPCPLRPALEQLEDRSLLSPTVLDPNLEVRTVATFLPTVQPTSMAFLRVDNPNDILVLEKQTGIVQRVISNIKAPVLDLAVNNVGERGGLGLVLHPNFHDSDATTPQYVYIYWTESTTGADTNVAANTPLLGNRVDRFIWNGSRLTFDQNIIRLRALQPPSPGFETGTFTNHNGGVLRFDLDGKLHIFIGDVGRRGFTQNVLRGHGPGGADDQFGGPAPDNAHLTGVILRLNDDGTTPTDNPFFGVGADIAQLNPEVGANIQRMFSYGHRNAFGLAVDPHTGQVWLAENGDDSFTEINLVLPGQNGGWIQIMGPLSRVAEFRQIETGNAPGFPVGMFRGLQQTRFSPDELPHTADEALANMFFLPGAHYSDPEFSWKFEVAPAAIGFINSAELGDQYIGDLIVGGARTTLAGGPLFRFNLNDDRTGFAFDDPRLLDLVADNRSKFDIQESDSLLFGINFGIVTDIHTGPDGHLYLVSLSNSAVYEIRPRAVPVSGLTFIAVMTNDQEVVAPGVVINTNALGVATFRMSDDFTRLEYTVYLFNIDIDGNRTPGDLNDNLGGLHIHRNPAGLNGPIVFGMIGPDTDTDGPFVDPVAGIITGDWDLTEGNAGADLGTETDELLSDGLYINAHTRRFPGGEVRGQIRRIS